MLMCLGLASPSLLNMIGMTSSVSLIETIHVQLTEKDNMEEVKQGHVECLASLFVKHVVTRRSFLIKVMAISDASKASFKITITLLLRKMLIYL